MRLETTRYLSDERTQRYNTDMLPRRSSHLGGAERGHPVCLETERRHA
jgi:hypothetical protein